MAIKKISDFASGNILQPVDKVLVARGATNVYVTGASVPATQNFNPVFASMFPNGCFGNGALTPILAIDHPRGLQFAAPSLEKGFRLMTRPIPDAQRDNFWFVARVSYAGERFVSGAGIAVSTGPTGTAEKVVSMVRYQPYYNDSKQASSTYYDGSTETNLFSMAAEYRWMRCEVHGSVVSMFGSEDGLFWNPCGSQDVGAPITEYGFYYRCDTDFALINEVALCDYFDSTELSADPLVRQAGRVVTKAAGIDTPHQYWRLNISKNWGSTILAIGWIVMRSTVGGPNLCVGGTPFDGGRTDGGYQADYSFQGGPVTPSYPGWQSNRITGYIGYRFPFPVTIREIGYQRSKAGGYDACPRDLTVEYSDDGVTWAVANTYMDLPVAEYAQFNTVLANPKDAVKTAANPAAVSLGLTRDGCRAAYSTRRLFDAYNGPLFAVQTATNNVDIFAGANGQADLTALAAAAGSSFAVITSWYDQSGHGLHASPLSSIDPLSVGVSSNRPVVVTAGAPVIVGGKLALAFDSSPLDVVGANFMTGSTIVVRGSFKKAGMAPVLSMLTTNVSALSFGFDGNGLPSASNLDQTLNTGTVAITDDAVMTLVARVTTTNSISTVQTGSGVALDGSPQTLSFGSAQPAPLARIGGAAYKNTIYDQNGYNLLNGGKINEILVYDSSVDITADFTKSS